MGKGYKGVNPKGGKGGKGGPSRGESDAQAGQLKQKWRATADTSSEEESGSEEEESGSESEAEEEVKPRRPIPGELPPNSSDEDESGSESEDDDDDDPLLNPHARPARAQKEPEPAVQKSKKELAAEMEKLKIVRERREKERLERIAREGYDRFLPPGAPGGPPKVD